MKTNRPPLKPADVHPAHVLRDEYGFNADNRPTICVKKDEVPDNLQHLIPYVEKWAIPCDVTRGDFFDVQGEEEVARFYYDVEPFIDDVASLIDAQPHDVGDWSEAAVYFMYFLKAHDEAYQPTPEEIAEREAKFAVHRAKIEKDRAIEQSLEAFKAKEYIKVAKLLGPYEDSLDGSISAKLRYAKKKDKQIRLTPLIQPTQKAARLISGVMQ